MEEKQPEFPLPVSDADWAQTPASVKALVMSLLSRLEKLEIEVNRLSAENGLLKEQVKKNSQNSSLPPSEDKGKGFQVKAKDPKARQRGGQPGHEGHRFQFYREEECERIEDYYPELCQACGAALRGEDPAPHRVQQVELPPIKPVVVEHRFHQLSCPCCEAVTRGWDTTVLNQSLYGERLSAVVGLLSGVGRQSHSQVQGMLSEIFNVELSTGSISRLRAELSDALSASVEEAGSYVRGQAQVNMDETGFRQGNSDGNNREQTRGWLWVMVTPLVSYFSVFLSRSQAVAQDLLGKDYGGVVGSDRCPSYSWLDLSQRQVCWAHLKRDFTQISERSGVSHQLGEDLLEQQKKLFELWYQVRDGTLAREPFQQQVLPIRAEVQRLLTEGAGYDIAKGETTPLAKTVRTCIKMLKLEPAFWTFVAVDGVEPTNNSAERALRPAVLWRKLSWGSQSRAGSSFVARIMTVVTTLKAQQKDVLPFLALAIRQARLALNPPSLLPQIPATP
jgi:transposase